MTDYYEKEYDEIFVQDCFHANGLNLSKSKNSKIIKKDITEYFVFDENENNIIEKRNLFKKCKKKKGKDINVNYNVCSFFSSVIRPDIYTPLGVLKGSNYELIPIKDKSKEEDEKEAKKEEEDVISVSSFDSVEEDLNLKTKKFKEKRYFNIHIDITVKCKICGEIGHIKKDCPNYDIKFCHRCIQIGHEDKDCDKKKCFIK